MKLHAASRTQRVRGDLIQVAERQPSRAIGEPRHGIHVGRVHLEARRQTVEQRIVRELLDFDGPDLASSWVPFHLSSHGLGDDLVTEADPEKGDLAGQERAQRVLQGEHPGGALRHARRRAREDHRGGLL